MGTGVMCAQRIQALIANDHRGIIVTDVGKSGCGAVLSLHQAAMRKGFCWASLSKTLFHILFPRAFLGLYLMRLLLRGCLALQ